MDQRTGPGGDRITTPARQRAQERAKAALEGRLAGKSYRTIADELGYASAGSVHTAVRKQLAAIPREAADELRTVELERLDELVQRNLAVLRGGDVTVTLNLLRIIDQRARLTGLYSGDTSGEHQDLKRALSGFLAATILEDTAEQPAAVPDVED